MSVYRLAPLLICALAAPIHAADEPARPDKAPAEFAHLKYRAIGPSTGGRVSRVTGIPGDPLVYYAATAAGGVWKSEDGGLSFKPVFDDQPVSSIGSIAVAPSDPNVIYVGTGEANIRGNVAAGNGIYKSTDAGKSWKHVWNQLGHIGTVIVHPTNPDIAFAAVLGHAFGPNAERGVYRTRDGGKTWQRVLFKDENTGASDVCFNPSNPRTLFAGLWQTRRRPWEMTSGGPGGGLYVSHDSGDTWELLGPKPPRGTPETKEGLPLGPYGKVCVAVAPSDPNRVYAMIEAEKGGLYRSDDGGKEWSWVCSDHAIRRRPWYFSTLTVDPTNADVVYAPNVPLMRSIDGGKTFKVVKGTHHADHHDCWIDPKNPKRLIVCNDGGVDISSDGGKSWYAPPLPIAQFYHVACDNSVPYRVMGTMQDQGTASGPSNSLSSAGIVVGDWHNVGGGEAGYAVPDPSDPHVIYAGEYSGIITRYDHRTRQARHVGVYPFSQSGHGAEALKYRFQWTAPILISRHDPKTVYHAGNVLFRSRDGGQSWEKLGGDLTRDDKNKLRWSGGPITGDNTGVEVYCTIFALAESPKDPKVLWAGSDDGLVHVTRNGGTRWENVTANVPDLPDWATILCIEASPFDARTAYLVADAHRLDDYHPYLWKTTDYGATWAKITDGLPSEVYCHVVREDPKRKGLLYLGTERGVMFSGDAGKSWKPLKLNMPTVAVHDLVVKDNDLVVGTNGRSVWILDDLTPVREWSKLIAGKVQHLFAIQPTIRWRYHPQVSSQQERGVGENPPKGAVFNYYLKKKPKNPPTIEVLDEAGKSVIFIDGKDAKTHESEDEEGEERDIEPRRPEVPAAAGVNRFVWDLTHAGAEIIPKAKVDGGNPAIGPLVAPGTFTVKVTVDGKAMAGKLTVLIDPRVTEPRGSRRADLGREILEIAPRVADGKSKADEAPWLKRAPGMTAIIEEAKEQEKLALRLRDDISKLSGIVRTIRSSRKQLNLQEELLDAPRYKSLRKQGMELRVKLDALEARLHNPKAEVGYDILAQRGGARLYSQLSVLLEFVTAGDGPPTQGMTDATADLEQELANYEAQFQALKKDELSGLNDLAKKLQAPMIWVPEAKPKK
jgi:photosystem II stability/assembly factor-like uncharacterized protein